MASEMSVFARFPASCLGIAPPVVRPLRPARQRGTDGPRHALSRAPHLPPVVRPPLPRLATRHGRGRAASSAGGAPCAISAPRRPDRAGQGKAGQGGSDKA